MERFLIKQPSKADAASVPSVTSKKKASTLSGSDSSNSNEETNAERYIGVKSKRKINAVNPAKKRIIETRIPDITPVGTTGEVGSPSTLTIGRKNNSSSSSDSYDSMGENEEQGKAPVKKMRKKYKAKLNENWTSKFSWLEIKSNHAFCKACLKVISGGKTHLKRHEGTSAHQSRIKSAEKTVEIQDLLRNEQRQEQNEIAELKMTMFLHEHNLPFLLMDHLPKLISSICPDSKVAKRIKCARTKATALTRDCIAAQQKEDISEKLRNGIFSIIIDETTDVSSEKSLVIVTRFYDSEKGQCRDAFFGLIKVTSCTSEDIFKAIVECLENQKIPLTNMIGLAADNASVMMGNINGVQARFKQVIPNLFVLGCVCHSFHLCSSAAARQLPHNLEELIRSIYNYFSHSSNRSARLREFQVFVELKPHKILHPSQTRWLSLQAAVDRVIENWEALILFFTNECFEDNLSSTQTILGQLKCPIFKVYFTFMSYVLDLVNKLNIEFQTEKPKIYLLLSRVKGLYRTILRNFIELSHLETVELQKIVPSNPRNFIKLEKVYFGVKTDLLLSNNNIEPQDIHNFRTYALAFYVALSEQIKKRFNFDDPALLFVSQFNPTIALSGSVASIAVDASKLFPQLVDDMEKLNGEWRLLADLQELKVYQKSSIEDFWPNIFEMKNELKDFMFPNLVKLVKGIFCLPHSSAAAERVFSQLNLLKNKTRNRLHIDTCETLLHAKEMLGNNTCYGWQPSSKLLKRKPQYTAPHE